MGPGCKPYVRMGIKRMLNPTVFSYKNPYPSEGRMWIRVSALVCRSLQLRYYMLAGLAARAIAKLPISNPNPNYFNKFAFKQHMLIR